jgi:8-oxo-dGTP pyrophosphatase MutT (NUDIX family)
VLLTRRADNGRWCIPGGQMEAGESAAECCAREIWEETGLRVQVGRLTGIYSDPHRVVEYADGNRYHYLTLTFECTITEGALTLSDETTEVGYFSLAEMETMDVIEAHRERIADALTGQVAAFVK